MEFIEPHQIPDAILRLIDEAVVEITMVTPQCKISNWPTFLKKIDQAHQRDIAIQFYIKDGDYKSVAEVEALNIAPTLVKNLNSMIFMNESYAIIATKHLMFAEGGTALEIAFKTTEHSEFVEIKKFFNTYILNESHRNETPVPIHRYMKFEVAKAIS